MYLLLHIVLILSFFCFDTDWSLDTSLFCKRERFKFERTIFAKLFGVKAPLSSKIIAQIPKRNRVGDTKIKLNTNNEDLMRMVLKL